MKISAVFPLSFFVSLIIAPHYNFIHINNCWQSPGSLLLIWIYLSKFFSFLFHSSKKWLEYTKGSFCEAKHLKLIWILQIQWIKSWIIFVFFSFKSLLKKLTNTLQIAENSILFWKECSWMGSSLSQKNSFKEYAESFFWHMNGREYLHLCFPDFFVVQNFDVRQVHYLV